MDSREKGHRAIIYHVFVRLIIRVRIVARTLKFIYPRAFAKSSVIGTYDFLETLAIGSRPGAGTN